MYFPRNLEFGSTLPKLMSFGRGEEGVFEQPTRYAIADGEIQILYAFKLISIVLSETA
jgi:hypothetical protein